MSFKFFIAMSAVALVLSGCGSSSDDAGDGGSNVNVITVTGKTMALLGSWETACATENRLTDNAFDKRETLEFSSDGQVAYVNASYTSSDGSCSGGVSAIENSYTATVSSQGIFSILAWLNGMGESVGAPSAQDGSALTNTEEFTGLTYTMTALTNIGSVQVGDRVQFGYVVDDTTSNIIMYRAENNNPQDSTGGTFDFFTKTGSVDDTGDTGGTGNTVTIVTESGGTLVLQGTYTSDCYLSGGSTNYIKDSHVFDGDSFIYRVTTYDTSGCSGEGTANDRFSATLSVSSNTTITDWVNGQGEPVQPPASAGGDRFLSASAATSILDATLSDGQIQTFYVADDTGSAPVLYRSDVYSADAEPRVATISVNDKLIFETSAVQ